MKISWASLGGEVMICLRTSCTASVVVESNLPKNVSLDLCCLRFACVVGEELLCGASLFPGEFTKHKLRWFWLLRSLRRGEVRAREKGENRRAEETKDGEAIGTSS